MSLAEQLKRNVRNPTNGLLSWVGYSKRYWCFLMTVGTGGNVVTSLISTGSCIMLSHVMRANEGRYYAQYVCVYRVITLSLACLLRLLILFRFHKFISPFDTVIKTLLWISMASPNSRVCYLWSFAFLWRI